MAEKLRKYLQLVVIDREPKESCMPFVGGCVMVLDPRGFCPGTFTVT